MEISTRLRELALAATQKCSDIDGSTTIEKTLEKAQNVYNWLTKDLTMSEIYPGELQNMANYHELIKHAVDSDKKEKVSSFSHNAGDVLKLPDVIVMTDNTGILTLNIGKNIFKIQITPEEELKISEAINKL